MNITGKNLYDESSDGDDSSTKLSKKVNKSEKRSSKKVLAEWDDDAIGTLISCVKARECLWNAKLKEYRNKKHREKAWQEIYHILNEKYMIPEISAKWGTLRIQFNCYGKKYKKQKSSQGTDEYTKYWRFFKPMLFLKTVEPKSEPAEKEQSSNSESNFSFENVPLSPRVPSRKRKSEPTTSTHATDKVAFNEMDPLNKINDEHNDEFQIFGDFIATELRKIPKKKDAYKMQRNMQRMLLDFMDELDDNASSNIMLWRKR